MITRMKKYTFLVYHKEYLAFLDEIRKMGVLDVEEKNSEANSTIQENLKVKAQLIEVSKGLSKRKPSSEPEMENRTISRVVEEYKALLADQEIVKQKSATLSKLIRDYEPFGDFSPEKIKDLRKNDIRIRLYTCPEARMKEEWSRENFIEIINILNSQVYFVVLTNSDGDTSSIDAEDVTLPVNSPAEMRSMLKEFDDRLQSIEKRLDEMAVIDLPLIKEWIRKIDTENHFETVILNTSKEAGEKLSILTGYIPDAEKKQLDDYLEKAGIVHLSSDPQPGDKVPVILKNNRYARLFEPISKIYMLPSYWELDLTPYFAPFYMLFFGFCFGDMGYSLLYIACLLVALRFIKDPMFRTLIYLGMFLSLGGIIFGILSGTFFGASIGSMNIPFLKAFMEQKGVHFLTIRESMVLSFILGGIQMLFGMVLKARNITKISSFRHSIPVIGWIILFVSSITNGLLGYIYTFPFDNLPYWIVFGVSLFMILFMNSPGKNPFVNLGAGLWDAYNMVVGAIGDLLSYVRLFALGMAGGMLGSSFNNIGSICSDIPYVGWLLALVVLIAGHAINIFMSTIGSFVHPLRLTFVEFYKNAGFSGGGKTYKPFKN